MSKDISEAFAAGIRGLGSGIRSRGKHNYQLGFGARIADHGSRRTNKLQLNNSPLQGDGDGLCSVRNGQFSENTADVQLHRAFGDVQR
jgi:hypothetical protein